MGLKNYYNFNQQQDLLKNFQFNYNNHYLYFKIIKFSITNIGFNNFTSSYNSLLLLLLISFVKLHLPQALHLMHFRYYHQASLTLKQCLMVRILLYFLHLLYLFPYLALLQLFEVIGIAVIAIIVEIEEWLAIVKLWVGLLFFIKFTIIEDFWFFLKNLRFVVTVKDCNTLVAQLHFIFNLINEGRFIKV